MMYSTVTVPCGNPQAHNESERRGCLQASLRHHSDESKAAAPEKKSDKCQSRESIKSHRASPSPQLCVFSVQKQKHRNRERETEEGRQNQGRGSRQNKCSTEFRSRGVASELTLLVLRYSESARTGHRPYFCQLGRCWVWGNQRSLGVRTRPCTLSQTSYPILALPARTIFEPRTRSRCMRIGHLK